MRVYACVRTYTRVSDIVDSESCHGHAWSRHIHATEWFRGRENSPDLPQAAVRELAIERKPGDVTGPRNATMAEIFDSLLFEQRWNLRENARIFLYMRIKW